MMIGDNKALQSKLRFRQPDPEDGGRVFEFVRHCGSLDLNSPYCYLLVCNHFANTSVVAEEDGVLAGFLSGYLPSGRPDVLFVWQVGVGREFRQRGVGKKLLREALARPACAQVRYLEASVTPSNQSSLALFTSIARELGTQCEQRLLFGRKHFAPVEHEDEILLRIGPINSNREV